MNALECKCFLCKHHLNVDIYRVVICFLCIFLPNFVPLLTPIALICWVMSDSVDRSSVTCGNVISDADLRNRQWWFRAASYSILPAGTVGWRRWKTMMLWCLWKPVSELRQARLIVVDIGDAVCLFRQSWGVSRMAVALQYFGNFLQRHSEGWTENFVCRGRPKQSSPFPGQTRVGFHQI